MDSMDRVGFGGPGWHSCVTTNPGPLDSQTQSPPGQAARRALTDDTELSARAAVAEEGTCLHQEDRQGWLWLHVRDKVLSFSDQAQGRPQTQLPLSVT